MFYVHLLLRVLHLNIIFVIGFTCTEIYGRFLIAFVIQQGILHKKHRKMLRLNLFDFFFRVLVTLSWCLLLARKRVLETSIFLHK